MFKWISELIFQLVNLVNNLTYALALDLLGGLIPPLGDIIDNISIFFDTYVWNMLYFVKKIFTNVLCFPPELFHSLAGFFSVVLLVRGTLKLYIGCLNVYSLIKNARSAVVPPAPEQHAQITDYYVE